MENGHALTKADLIEALEQFRKEIRGEFRADLTAQKDQLTEEMRQIETNLLTEFHRYGKGQQIRLHSLENNDGDLKSRLAIIEERLLALEARRPPSV